MDASSFIRVRLYKSPLRVVAGVLLRSREVQVRRVQKQALVLQELRCECEELRRVNAQQALALQESQREVLQLRSENRQWREQPLELPCDLPLPQHGYGARMMAVCVNLAQATGLRSSVRCLRIVLDWLGVAARLPDWTTVRTWLMRSGVAALEEPVEVADDWVWLADHSNQIGPEKVLVVLGVRASKLPPPGVALTHADMRVLAVEPGVSWKREDMSRVYATLAARVGAPQALIVDGAVELREGAEVLRTLRPDVVILSDFKHHAANVWKKIVGGSEAFTRFTTQVGRTRSAIQQTELAHLTPPGSRPKARFMNLAPTLTWARMALWQLDHPESLARATITSDRMHEKLGWLADFSDDIPRWNACQEVVHTALTFINQHGLSHGTAERLAALLTPLTSDPLSGSVAQRLVDFVRQSAAQLPPASPAPLTPPLTENPLAPHHSAAPAPLRLPLSTEILESAFGLFKQLEQQHSRSGFTSLLAAFGALLQPATPTSIRQALSQVSVKHLHAWVKQHLKTTLASLRQTAYQESPHPA